MPLTETLPVAVMGRPKSSGPPLEAVKIERDLLDKARSVFPWIRRQPTTPAGYTMATYISDCIRGQRSLLKDYAAYIADAAKQLKKQ